MKTKRRNKLVGLLFGMPITAGKINAAKLTAQQVNLTATATVPIGSTPSSSIPDTKDDDLLELLILANKNLKKDGIKITIRKHPAAEAEPEVKNLLGYYPTGEMQIIFEKDMGTSKGRISCIRGYTSFGQYELMGVSGINTGDPERFEDPKDVVRWVREKLK